MIVQTKGKLKLFRERVYQFFNHRRDASIELIDALSSNTAAKSVVELSLNPLHRRNYCSITRALGEFYPGLNLQGRQKQNHHLTELLTKSCIPSQKRTYHLIGLDCTPNPRVFSPTLKDRSFVYSPNSIAGNKPISIGHEYSLAVYMPEKSSKDAPPWVIPLSCERVASNQKSIMVGVEQIKNCISQPSLQNKLCLSVGDCAYSNPAFISEANKNQHQVHVTRARNNRIFYLSPEKKKKAQKKEADQNVTVKSLN